MHGSPLSVLAEIVIPDADQCFHFAAPFLILGALYFLWQSLDEIIHRLFPHWEWERKLGWLNFAAHRRADAVMRWLGYFVYAILAVALLGIVWTAEGLPEVHHWDEPPVLADLLLRVSVLVVSLGLWLFYLGGYLIPRMRGQYEEEELEKFREEQKELESEQDLHPQSRLSPPSRSSSSKTLDSSKRSHNQRQDLL